MYIHDPKLWNPRIINSRLGKWTDEEPDRKITHFRGLGPKDYAYHGDKGPPHGCGRIGKHVTVHLKHKN